MPTSSSHDPSQRRAAADRGREAEDAWYFTGSRRRLRQRRSDKVHGNKESRRAAVAPRPSAAVSSRIRAGMAELADAADLKASRHAHRGREAPTTAENSTGSAAGLLVAFGGCRLLFTHS